MICHDIIFWVVQPVFVQMSKKWTRPIKYYGTAINYCTGTACRAPTDRNHPNGIAFAIQPHMRQRRSIRLKNYDYSLQGFYFVTICIKNRECLLGDIVDGEMKLNQFGKMVTECWLEIPQHFPHVFLDEHIIMPNHFHGIIGIDTLIDICTKNHLGSPTDHCTGTACRAPTNNSPTTESFGNPIAGSIPTIIRSFKSAASKLINQTRHTPGTPVWQRNYYEHIIRNENNLNAIRYYIRNNPANWQSDDENLNID